MYQSKTQLTSNKPLVLHRLICRMFVFWVLSGRLDKIYTVCKVCVGQNTFQVCETTFLNSTQLLSGVGTKATHS